jgi:hypothetical protein
MTRVAMSVGMGGVAEMENEGEGGRKQRLLMVFAAAAGGRTSQKAPRHAACSLSLLSGVGVGLWGRSFGLVNLGRASGCRAVAPPLPDPAQSRPAVLVCWGEWSLTLATPGRLHSTDWFPGSIAGGAHGFHGMQHGETPLNVMGKRRL